MCFHSIPEPEEKRASTEVPAVTPAIPAPVEMDAGALARLLDFFLLLEEWDRQEEQL